MKTEHLKALTAVGEEFGVERTSRAAAEIVRLREQLAAAQAEATELRADRDSLLHLGPEA